jgi:hypothetical protein
MYIAFKWTAMALWSSCCLHPRKGMVKSNIKFVLLSRENFKSCLFVALKDSLVIV